MEKSTHKSIYDISFQDINRNKIINLSSYKGKVILIVNTASKCGFTKQYEGLEDLWQRYKDKGLVIIGVPSNDFGQQEPGDENEILEFCRVRFGVTFPLASKTNVSGEEAHLFFKLAKEELGWLAAPKWNFYKYLINREGKIVNWFSSKTTPESKSLIDEIEKYLNEE